MVVVVLLIFLFQVLLIKPYDEEAQANLAHCLRFCFAIVDFEHLHGGCARLKQAIQEYRNK